MAEIRIVGTAHVSQKSVDDVRTAIEEYTPEVVAIELDPSRFKALKQHAADHYIFLPLEVDRNIETFSALSTRDEFAGLFPPADTVRYTDGIIASAAASDEYELVLIVESIAHTFQ